MPRATILIALTSTALLAGCASRAPGAHGSAPAPTPDAQATAAAPGGLRIPDRVGGLELVETFRYPEAEMGTIYRFRDGSALHPDVYVYPLTRTARDGGEEPLERARAESRLFLATLQIQQHRGAFQRFEVMADGPIAASAAGGRRGWHTGAVLVRPGQARHTHQHLFAIGEQMLKVRTTFAEDEGLEADLGAFLDALLDAIGAR